MKKLLAVALALVLVLGMVACGGEEENVGMPNPVTECASLEEVNELTGMNLVHPAVMGVTDESFSVIDCGDYNIGQYEFTVGGVEYTLRGSMEPMEISGYYTEDGTLAFENDEIVADNVAYYFDDEAKLAQWCTMDGVYVLMAKDGGEMHDETFFSIVDEFVDLTGFVDWSGVYEEIAGTYQDETSGRASMEIASEGNHAAIVIEWANSADSIARWTMTAEAWDDGTLNYTDCKKEIVSYDEEGNETVDSVEYENGAGYFVYSSEAASFAWEGAAEENAQECVFVKID